MASRKRYKGDYNPDIQSYNPKTGEYKKYTEWIGKDMWATIDQNGMVYFVSDEKNGEYNLGKLENGKTKNLTNFKTSIKRPIVSADGSKVVFEKDYQLFTYEPATDKTSKLSIRIVRNSLLPKEQNFSIAGKISDFDVSPDNKKIAFISRGELFVSDIEGKYIVQMHPVETHNYASPNEVQDKRFERIMSVKWLSDNKTLLYNQTWNGYLSWFTLPVPAWPNRTRCGAATGSTSISPPTALNRPILQAAEALIFTGLRWIKPILHSVRMNSISCGKKIPQQSKRTLSHPSPSIPTASGNGSN